jgi:hypothetical protein
MDEERLIARVNKLLGPLSFEEERWDIDFGYVDGRIRAFDHHLWLRLSQHVCVLYWFLVCWPWRPKPSFMARWGNSQLRSQISDSYRSEIAGPDPGPKTRVTSALADLNVRFPQFHPRRHKE